MLKQEQAEPKRRNVKYPTEAERLAAVAASRKKWVDSNAEKRIRRNKLAVAARKAKKEL